ncbi:MAG: hypothetical protein ACKV2Q_25330 [Planctomycetaceae bacterium]
MEPTPANTTGATFETARRFHPLRLLGDVLVAVALVGVLLAVGAVDRARPVVVAPPPDVPKPPPDEPEPEPPPPPVVLPAPESLPPIDPTPRITVSFLQPGRFGIVTTSGNPDDDSDDGKRLTFSVKGDTNNTRLWVDGATPLVLTDQSGGEDSLRFAAEQRRESVANYRDIQVSQVVELTAGDISRRMDTVRVVYRLKNTGSADHSVGLRVMLDTLIGNNDGVPFIVPGVEGIVTEATTFRGEQVPDFVRALERPNLSSPGVIVDIGLRARDAERPSEVILAHWPGGEAEWNYERAPLRRDSAAGLYYEPRPLKPDEQRTVGFTYGLGTISSTKTRNAKLSLTVGGPFRSGGQFWVVALVQNAKAGQTVKLTLPEGMKLTDKHTSEQAVTAGVDVTQLSWLVMIDRSLIGNAELKATLEPDAAEERQSLTIQPRDARLTLIAKGPVQSGKPFWVVALVQNPRAGQTAELQLPAGLTLDPKHTASKPVPTNADYAQISWLVRAAQQQPGSREITVRLQPDAIQESTPVMIERGNLVQ